MERDVKASYRNRLSLIQSEVRVLSEMVDSDHCRIEIVTRISAVRAALRRVEEKLLRASLAHCAERAIRRDNGSDRQRKLAELLEVVSWASK
ncbi:metal-sensing transcriptional repressor [Bradyrhizobium sp. CIAT3101]|uniref:metal-sensitive transcriptional regulator n=1 Tax=Bradyrhizobium sp. CIAT3101 TaxID=439387 RepID=UPI0024B173B1|nr:metal-sensing transcriptional repressor [Bradyrhizobium sp. CIAT3101]WFU80692.1 metal-sensing transcriptional repressor [Bradyrhizobium sp. CIAT3101]